LQAASRDITAPFDLHAGAGIVESNKELGYMERIENVYKLFPIPKFGDRGIRRVQKWSLEIAKYTRRVSVAMWAVSLIGF